METLFISDVHLSEYRLEMVHVFLNFLSERVAHADALYILGDLFHVWIGDDDVNPFNQIIVHEIRKLTQQGIPIYILRGNRDFLIGKKFMKDSGCRLLKDLTVRSIYKTPILLTHGDRFCTRDISFQTMRKILYHPFFRFLYLRLPLRKRFYLAQYYRKLTVRLKRKKQVFHMNIDMERLSQWIHTKNTQYVIHGHTHQSGIHLISTQNNQTFTQIVLGPWTEYGSFLRCCPHLDQSVSFSLHSFL